VRKNSSPFVCDLVSSIYMNT